MFSLAGITCYCSFFLCVVHVFLMFSAQLQNNLTGAVLVYIYIYVCIYIYIYIFARVYPKNTIFIVRFQCCLGVV